MYLWTFSNKPCWISDNVLDFVFLCFAGLDPRKPLVKNILECKHMMGWDHILILLGMFINTCKMQFAIWAMKYLTQGVSCEVWSWHAINFENFYTHSIKPPDQPDREKLPKIFKDLRYKD